MTAALAPIDEDWDRLRSQVRRMLGSRLASGADVLILYIWNTRRKLKPRARARATEAAA